MRRILVPLDGSAFAESIIPDARRLAGTNGELILVRDASMPRHDSGHEATTGFRTIGESQQYLDQLAHRLREQGVRVREKTTFLHDVAVAIDEMAKIFDADMIACATHGRSAIGRFVRGGAAWRAVAGSRVPVLLRHAEASPEPETVPPSVRRILVPLDGSEHAETAVPLAQKLALEWKAEIVLVRVVVSLPTGYAPYAPMDAYPSDYVAEARDAQAYLDRIADDLVSIVRTHACVGSIEDQLMKIVVEDGITDIVMASHGRTGLSRVIMGSVADDLVHKLHLPIIVIPALAAGLPVAQEVNTKTNGLLVHA